jgi:hypothetical protein
MMEAARCLQRHVQDGSVFRDNLLAAEHGVDPFWQADPPPVQQKFCSSQWILGIVEEKSGGFSR